MYPNLFLKSFWQMDIRNEVFVAMSFDDRYKTRFTDIIEPAINSVRIGQTCLKAKRVDISKNGDSILTEIMDGIAHCQLFVADISTIGKDSVTSHSYRNGNVMYEVGLALASRQSSEIVLIRDDKEKMLFDVSTIPHMIVDFTDTQSAINQIAEAIVERLNERKLIHDARVRSKVASLDDSELKIIEMFSCHGLEICWGFKDDGKVHLSAKYSLLMLSLPRLLDKGIIKLAGKFPEGHTAYQWTLLGLQVCHLVKQELPTLKRDVNEKESHDIDTDINKDISEKK